ncbi:AcvB/VirJ family lysyl-phosphatidylglycerol hydrolase [Novosphingobium bradum]|uniref:AcvB/VirJ family lysyl-phosphatidylglycerol hydrolase n=1 Tax=Novosphingobium bradum TaxID=1737444 RepID=A0ABV7IPQ5_9SPHN
MIPGAGLALACAGGVLGLGDYFGSEAQHFTPVVAGAQDGPARLVAVFWSGDMGLRIGFGSDLPERLARQGIPVLAVSSPVLFATGRSPAFARDAVARSLTEAIRRSGARQVAVIGFSFGADVLAASIGQLEPALRGRIAQVVLVGPGTGIHFHANPFGLFYTGRSEADPGAIAASLKGLRLSCIFATGDADESLCRQPALRRGRLTGIDDGHMMLAHREEVTRAVVRSVLDPAEPLS